MAVAPMLSISQPTGLRLGAESSEIRINDEGYQVLSALPLRVDSSASLQVKPGNTLALVGNGIMLDGGAIATPSGRIELGSVQDGIVTLTNDDKTPNQWVLSYGEVQNFGDIELLSQSLINTSDLLFGSSSPRPIGFGARGGDIQLQGRQISVRDGSIGLIQNFGDSAFGDIRVNASDLITVEGIEASQQVNSGFATTSFGAGRGGDIYIDARQLYATDDGTIITETFGQANSGNLVVEASDSILFELADLTSPGSGKIFSVSYGAGNAGDIEVRTGRLSIEDSGIASRNIGSGPGGAVRVYADEITLSEAASIASASLGSGPGGDVFVEADIINIVGVEAETFFPSTIAASTIHSGNAGNITIKTGQLRLQDGGRIDASTFAMGDAGTVTINATDLVDVQGTVPGSINPSLISSTANEVDPALRAFFEAQGVVVPVLPSGDAGDVTINAPMLIVREGAQVTVRNDGSGDAGLLTVNADTIRVAENAGITASTQQGSGGNVVLSAGDVVLLRQGSQVSAEAGGAGDGGNLTITTPVLVALENSDIIANAVQGMGGNIQINSQGIIGTEFRDQLTAESDITASSEFGVNGVVEITNLEVEPSSGIVALPETVSDVSGQIVAGCATTEGSQFVATGRGGLPPNPTRSIEVGGLWHDLRPLIDLSASDNSFDAGVGFDERRLAEATAWTNDARGRVVLVANSAAARLERDAIACLKTGVSQGA